MKLVRWLVIAVYSIAATLPLLWMAITSIKTRGDTISSHARFIPSATAPDDPRAHTFRATLDSYGALNSVHAGAQHSFWHHLESSVLIGLSSTLGLTFTGAQRDGVAR